ncbi:hypothetical protein [Pseudoalteromonas phenolica]|uniref:hypothetical protein n=1 Tax=Pseudoalteromonas phenolica TaxID=161398 RepID=UPI00384C0F68
MKKLIFTFLISVFLSGCFDDNDSDNKNKAELSGTVAVGVAVAGASIEVTDASGNTLDATAQTDASGNYTITFSDEVIPAPILIKVATDNGEELSAIVDDPTTNVANVNPITSYVADKVLADTELADIAQGGVKEVGQAVVTSVFGEGAQYNAFANTAFIAKTSAGDTQTEASTADVLLDTLSDIAGSQSVTDLLSATDSSEATLIESKAFVVSFATNLAETDGEAADVSEVFDTTLVSSTVSAQLSVVQAVQSVAEEVLSTVKANTSLSESQQNAAVKGLMNVVANIASTDDAIDTTSLSDVASNVITNLADDIVNVVTSEAAADFSETELLEVAENAANDIVEVIEEKGVDLTQSDADLTEVEEDLGSITVKLDSQINWDDANWDELTWQ